MPEADGNRTLARRVLHRKRLTSFARVGGVSAGFVGFLCGGIGRSLDRAFFCRRLVRSERGVGFRLGRFIGGEGACCDSPEYPRNDPADLAGEGLRPALPANAPQTCR
jgi:hypothetical protein